MFCLHCGVALSGASSSCERCGTPRARVAGVGRPGGDADGPVLSRANLLRMRGQWAEAAEQCVDVLRRDPGSPAAHSLLGDIYQDQGRPEEARHWYQLALVLNPGSVADRAKLARAEETLDAR